MTHGGENESRQALLEFWLPHGGHIQPASRDPSLALPSLLRRQGPGFAGDEIRTGRRASMPSHHETLVCARASGPLSSQCAAAASRPSAPPWPPTH